MITLLLIILLIATPISWTLGKWLPWLHKTFATRNSTVTLLFILLFIAIAAPTPAWAVVDISTCDGSTFTTDSETYRLTADLVCDSDGGGVGDNAAIRIDAANPTFDFNGHTLEYANDETGYGIHFVSSTGSITITNSDSTAGDGTIDQAVDLSSSENDLITTVTGTDTSFTSFFQVGDMIKPTSGSDQRPRIVTQINSDSELLVSFPWIQGDIENWDLDETTDLDPNNDPSWTETLSAGATYARIRGGIRFTKFANGGLPGNNTSNFVAHGIKVSGGTGVTSLTVTNVSFYLTPEPVAKDRFLIGLWITADPAAMSIQNNGFWVAAPDLTALTGTVSTGGSPSTSIVGSGTAFTTELRVGQGIQGEPGSGSGASYVVSIEDDEHLTADGNLTFTAGSTLYVGSHGEINGVRGDISVSSTGGLWQDNNFYLTGALSVGSTARNSWLRLNGLHPGGESGKHIFDGNTYRSKSSNVYGFLCDSCEWLEQRNQQFFKGGSGNQIWWDHCDDCELHGNLLLAGPNCFAGGLGNRGSDRGFIYRNIWDYRLSRTCGALEGGGTVDGGTTDHVFRDNKIFLSITGSGGTWNNRLFALECANEGYQFYNNTARIHRPAGAGEFTRAFILWLKLGCTQDDFLSAYNEIHRTSGDEGAVSKPYIEGGDGSTNQIICADVVDGTEVTEANHATYYTEAGTDDLTVLDDPSCGCEPDCGPTVGVRAAMGGDEISPTPGDSGTITTGSVGSTSLTLDWTKATDDVSAHGDLEYQVYQSLNADIDSVASASANGTIIQSYTADIATFDVTGLGPETTYYFNVIVQDEAGNKAAYTMVEETTAELQAPSVTTNTATNVTDTTATLNGTLDLGEVASASAFFRWREVGAGSFTETASQELTASGSFNQPLSALAASTLYEYKAVVTWNEGADEDEGELVEFTTGEYTFACTTEPSLMWDNDTLLTRGTVGFLAEGEWDWADGNCYLRLAGDEDPNTHTIEATVRDFGINIDWDDTPNVEFVGIEMEKFADTTLPNVSIIEPLDQASVSGTVDVAATATDDTALSGVQFKIVGERIIDEDTTILSDTASVSWDTTSVSNGTYTLTAFALDTTGNIASSSIEVMVDNDTTPPTPGDSGTITTGSVGSTSLTLDWTKATDDVSAQGDLEYQVYQSLNADIDSVASASANGTIIQSYTADIATFDVTGLGPETTYYFNVVVKDEAGNKAAYTMVNETTAQLQAPVVTTDAATNVTETTATLNATLDLGEVASASAFFRWREVGAGSFTETASQELTASGSFNQPLSALAASTSYEYKAVVTWNEGADEDEGDLVEFTTEPDTTPPTPGNSGTITTASVAATSLTLNWTKATDDISGQGALEYRVYQSDTNNIDTLENAEANGTPLNSFTADIGNFDVSGLTASTSYYFNVIVQDEAGNKAAYTMVNEATAQLGAPSVTTNAATNVGETTATLNGSLDIGEQGTVEVFFRWREVGAGSFTETTPQELTASGSFNQGLSDLQSNTANEFKAVVTWGVDQESEGSLLQFTTDAVLPSTTTNAATSVSETTATLNGTFDIGDEETVQVFFRWREKDVGDFVETTPEEMTASGSFNESLSDLQADTIYEYKAVVTWNDGADEDEGELIEFTTQADTTSPTPGNSGTIATASVGSTSLTLNWTKATDDVSAQGDLEYRVYQSSSANIDTVENAEANGTPLNSFTADIATFDVSGLDPDTTYYFNIIVQDEAGNKVAYTIVEETTAVFAISNVTVSDILDSSATINWTTSELATSKIRFGLVASLGFETIETDTAPMVTNHSVALTDLIPCSRYRFRVLSKDSGNNTAEGSLGSFDTTGCSGDSSLLDEATEQISVAGTGAFSLVADSRTVVDIATPANFTATVSQAYLQAKRVNRSQVLTALGTPAGKQLAQFHVYDFTMLASPSLALTSFDQPLTVTMTYIDSDIEGLDPDTLRIFRHTGAGWVELAGCTHNAGNKQVSCTTTQFSVFALGGDEEAEEPPPSGGGGSSGGGGGGGFTPVSTPTPTPTPTESEEETSFPQIRASYRPADFSLNEGDTISAAGSDDPDIYIVNEHGYKRLFLNPIIFSFYGHLGGFNNVKSISGDVRNAFPTSGLFRNCEADTEEVYAVEVSGEDTGTLHHVNMSGDQAVAEDEEFFKKVFCINNNEFNWYTDNGQTFGTPYTSLAQVPVYARTGSEAEAEQETEEETEQEEPEAEPELLLSTLVKTASDPTVYYIDSKGIRKPIPSVEIFLSYGNSFANVKTINQAQLDSLPPFQAVTVVGGDGRVWIIDMANRTRHWVTDLTVFEQLGLEWDRVVEVNQTEFEYYAEGSEAEE